MDRSDSYTAFTDWKKHVKIRHADIRKIQNKGAIARWVAIPVDSNLIIGVFEEYASSSPGEGYGVIDNTGTHYLCKLATVRVAKHNKLNDESDETFDDE